MKHLVNLDALIPRSDFEALVGPGQPASTNINSFSISELEPSKVTYLALRKPDFQRDTSSWKPETIVELVRCYVDGELIPSVILWRSKSGSIFVVDGAHRLSALVAWVHDDYGDGDISKKFFKDKIPHEQREAADETRQLMHKAIGPYEAMKKALSNEDANEKVILRARGLALIGLPLQLITTDDPQKAENSFYKVNQQGTPIDKTDLQIIQSRKKPNAIAARAIIRAGTGHQWWQKFDPEVAKTIVEMASNIYDVLFEPSLDEPIRTLDLPVGGRGYSGDSMRTVFEFVNFAHRLVDKKDFKQLKADEDGQETIQVLKNVRKLAWRIAGNHPSSLGLHPAVYFYGATGRYQAPVFLAVTKFVQDIVAREMLKKFTSVRRHFEEFLIKHKYFTNQIIGKYGSGGSRSINQLVKYFGILLDAVGSGLTDKDTIERIRSDKNLATCIRLLEPSDWETTGQGEFSKGTQSMIFLRAALDKAIRCAVCGARAHKNSFSYGHIEAKSSGGLGTADNAQIEHFYCNSSKEAK